MGICDGNCRNSLIYAEREPNMYQWEPSACFKTFRLLVRVHVIAGLIVFFYNFFILRSLSAITLTGCGWLAALFGLAFQVLAMQEFRKKGNASHGSFFSTTILVDSGVYAAVRHPMYLAGVLLVLGSVLISQHWLTLILGVVVFAWFPTILQKADKDLVEKFGSNYEQYMQSVPSVNFLLGMIRLRRNARERKS